MSARIRRLVAALAVALVISSPATTALAYSSDENANTPVVFDAMIVRPLGIVTFILGTSLFCAALPLVLVTRPTDIDKPFDALVIKPARFVWVDDLGGH